MHDVLTAGVRTAVQVVVAGLVSFAAGLGVTLPVEALEAVLFAAATGVVTIVLNYISTKIPVVGTVLSLGMAKSTPHYES